MILTLALAAASPLAGAWTLERVDAVMADSGRVVPNEAVDGADRATGLIVYDPSGWMSVQIGAGGRAPDKSGAVGRKRPIATGSYYACYGRYEIDAATGVVRHLIADSLMPPEIGITAVRHFKLEGGRLTLTSDPSSRPDGTRVNRIQFRRLTGAPSTSIQTGK